MSSSLPAASRTPTSARGCAYMELTADSLEYSGGDAPIRQGPAAYPEEQR